MSRERVVNTIAGLGAAAFLVFGTWPFFWPKSFYDQLATFEPYNVHFIHDIGAFQIGIGVALALALWRKSDALLAVLGGAGVGSVFHAVAHVRDNDLGGKDTDVFVFGFMAVLLLAGAWVRLMTPVRR